MKHLLLSVFALGAIAVQGQTIHKCYSKEAVDYQQSLMPDYQQRVNTQFELAKQWIQTHEPTRDLYTVPVVFHVVYNTTEENISDAILQNQIDILNEDYARLNADADNVRTEFESLVGPTNVRFVLASTDPDGNPTNGITRTATTVASFGTIDLDFVELEKVKSTADGGIDAWDQEHYLNIWVCDMSIDFLGFPLTLLLGYATPPDGLPNWAGTETGDLGDGVVLQYQVVGDAEHHPNDVLVDSKGRTAVHEVGHYLGLRHIWGDGDCTQDDGVEDTPDATEASSQDCDFTKNSCNADVVGLGDLHDMVENYMDYSAETCQNSFTGQQANLMHGVLENQRYELVHDNVAAQVAEFKLTTFTASPNPTNALIQLSAEKTIVSLSILDLNGRLLSQRDINEKETTVDINAFDAGMYLFTLRFSGGELAQTRVIKK